MSYRINVRNESNTDMEKVDNIVNSEQSCNRFSSSMFNINCLKYKNSKDKKWCVRNGRQINRVQELECQNKGKEYYKDKKM